jgi:hypothetical protein
MVGGRRLSVAACLCLAAGCAVMDASGEEDVVEAHCEPIVANAFDDTARWEDFSEPGASVVRERDAVRITSAPSEEEFSAYADLHSKAVLMVAGTELQAAVTVAEPDSAVGGISWTREADVDEDRDYYDLVVSSGSLVPLRREVGADQVDLCDGDCLPYDPVAHAFFRLRAASEDIVYEVSDGDGEWSEVARAPRGDEVYGASAYVYAQTPDTIDVSFTHMTWAACEP